MAKGTTELFEALASLAKEKGISPELLIEKIQTALVIAIKKTILTARTQISTLI